MKNIKNLIFYIPLAVLTIAFTSCGDNDETPQEIDVFLGCCSEEPVFGANVNNLDETNGEIIVYNLFTPNGDGINDIFRVDNIQLYNNHSVKIYNDNDELLFESNNYNSNSEELFPSQNQGEFGVEGLPDGTYKYKVVIENEQTFLKSGNFCLFGNFSALEEQNFSDCTFGSQFDPTLTGN